MSRIGRAIVAEHWREGSASEWQVRLIDWLLHASYINQDKEASSLKHAGILRQIRI